MERLIGKASALLVPWLFLKVTIYVNKLDGILSVGKWLIEVGMKGLFKLFFFLIILSILSDIIIQFVVDKLIINMFKSSFDSREDKKSIAKVVKKYPLSKGLKLRIIEQVIESYT